MQGMLVTVLVFAILVSVFAVQNATTVSIKLLFWTFEGISLSLIILGSVAAGAFLALVLGIARQLRMSWRIRELTGKLADLQHQAGKAKDQTPPGSTE